MPDSPPGGQPRNLRRTHNPLITPQKTISSLQQGGRQGGAAAPLLGYSQHQFRTHQGDTQSKAKPKSTPNEHRPATSHYEDDGDDSAVDGDYHPRKLRQHGRKKRSRSEESESEVEKPKRHRKGAFLGPEGLDRYNVTALPKFGRSANASWRLNPQNLWDSKFSWSLEDTRVIQLFMKQNNLFNKQKNTSRYVDQIEKLVETLMKGAFKDDAWSDPQYQGKLIEILENKIVNERRKMVNDGDIVKLPDGSYEVLPMSSLSIPAKQVQAIFFKANEEQRLDILNAVLRKFPESTVDNHNRDRNVEEATENYMTDTEEDLSTEEVGEQGYELGATDVQGDQGPPRDAQQDDYQGPDGDAEQDADDDQGLEGDA
ncbi:MAG: hypothetical protein M4579_006222 [Chaenotheca gracillima]|nr:MAG: hypothetical protein M4579_006222 [Chaenotheca gracillima]